MNTVRTEHTDQVASRWGLFDRYISVFISPDVLFQGLRRRPDWAGAMFLGSCLVLARTVLIPPELTIATLRERMLEKGNLFLRAWPIGWRRSVSGGRWPPSSSGG